MSSFFTQVCILIINAVMNNALVTYGASSIFGPDIPLAVVGIVMKVYSLVTSFVVGIAAGAQPVVGYNYGLKAYDRVRQLYKTIMAYEIAVGIVAFVIFEVFPMNVIQLFDSEGELYNEFALFALRVYFSTVVFCCVQKATSIFLQGIGKPLGFNVPIHFKRLRFCGFISLYHGLFFRHLWSFIQCPYLRLTVHDTTHIYGSLYFK